MSTEPIVFSAIQEISTGRVYVIFTDASGYYWLRARAGYPMRGPHTRLYALFEEMAVVEGKSADHWVAAFAQFRPEIETLADDRTVRPKKLSSQVG